MSELKTQCNIITQVTVSDLLDGRYFFIPSYQRGYRWSKQQVYDLCGDLLEYALLPNKSLESFYSLQPLIVRRGKYTIDGQEKEAYEVIDGQQRLTTIFLLYRFLAKSQRYTNLLEVSQDLANKELYHIYYETRKEDYSLLEKSGFKDFKNCDIRDIDIAHITNAFYYMKCWLENSKDEDQECAEALCALHGESYAKKTVVEKLFDLLNDRNRQLGCVQFIWYEIDATKDAIKEFLTENKGKIRLTDTEKIRALFMQRKSYSKDDAKNLKQLSIAKDWELIENTLHRNDFWSFISKDMSLEDGRINVIFKYIFENDPSSSMISKEGDFLFRYYYRHLAKNHSASDSLESNVDAMWKKVMECFRMLQNWYYNPMIYNLVGLLIKHGYSIKQISDIYNQDDVNTHEDFITELNKEVRREIIDIIPIEKGNVELEIPENEEYISLFFKTAKDKAKMQDLLRFINIREMNKIIINALADIDKEEDEKKRSDLNRGARDVMSHIYRFPFEALDVFGWDIEHIDSATTNSLSNPKEQRDWLIGAEDTLGDTLTKDTYYASLKNQIIDLFDNQSAKIQKPSQKETDALFSMVNYVHGIVEEDSSDVRKDWIGNLTLLDSGTNRSYKNKIFAWKKSILRARILAGVFVPKCTQNVFNKMMSGCSDTNWKWSHADKKAYHSFILSEIKEFKNEFAD